MPPGKEHCNVCDARLCYNERYDVHYCANCNEWREDPCKDEKCFFCTKRPKRPIIKSKSLELLK